MTNSLSDGSGRSILVYMFPVGYWSGDDPKERMHCGECNFKMLAINGWTAQLQFSEKPAPFILQLAIGDEHSFRGPNRTELGAIKGVTARKCLRVDEREVAVDGTARRGTSAKAP